MRNTTTNIPQTADNRRRKECQGDSTPSVLNHSNDTKVNPADDCKATSPIQVFELSHAQQDFPLNGLQCQICDFTGGLKFHSKVHCVQPSNAPRTTTTINRGWSPIFNDSGQKQTSQCILNSSQTAVNFPSSDQDVNLLPCHLCPATKLKKYKANRGLNLHIKRNLCNQRIQLGVS